MYWDVVINHDILSFILDEYIPEGILLRVVIIENNSSEYKGYGADIVENNDENNLYYAIGAASINESRILSGCTYINAINLRKIHT